MNATKSKQKTRKVAPAAIDPIFAAIAEHKAREKEWLRLNSKLDEAKFAARKTHGRRPPEMILWRDCDAYSEDGINARRDEFLGQPDADPEQIEKEYQDARARLAAAERAAVEWDQRAGIATLREQYERADLVERRAAMRMARTKPTTPAGAAALSPMFGAKLRLLAGSWTGRCSHSRRSPPHLPE